MPDTPARQAPSDWWSTTRQALPAFLKLVRRLRPTMHLPGLDPVDEEFLARHGIRGVLWDVDGTLMPHHHDRVAEELTGKVRNLLQSEKLRHAILSNCGEARFTELGRIFPEVAVIKGYTGAGGPLFRVHQAGGERWMRGTGTVEAPDPLRPLKKPSAELVHFATGLLGVAPEQTVMIGDQYFTDIAGANLAGVRSIKVPTMGRDSFPLAVRWFQRVESLLYRLLYRYG